MFPLRRRKRPRVEGFGDDEQARKLFREGLIVYADPICSEIERSVDYFRSTFGAETIKQIFLSGGGAMIPGIAADLAQRLGIETEIINPFKKITCDKRSPEQGDGRADRSHCRRQCGSGPAEDR